MNYFSKIGVAEFLCEASELKIGDEILITGPTTGLVQLIIKEIRVNLKEVNIIKKGDRFSIPLNQVIRRSDKIYKIFDTNKLFTRVRNGEQ
jgi:putative protease